MTNVMLAVVGAFVLVWLWLVLWTGREKLINFGTRKRNDVTATGHTAQPTNESRVIGLLARALWETTKFSHATHYLEMSLLENAVAVFEKTHLAGMKDEFVDRCAAEKNSLLVLAITGREGEDVTFMALSLPMDTDAAPKESELQ